MSPEEKDFVRRLHVAAIKRGKAEAALKRLPANVPAAFKLKAHCEVALTYIAWLRVYLEIIEFYKGQNAR